MSDRIAASPALRTPIQRQDFENNSRPSQNTSRCSACCACCVKIYNYIYEVLSELYQNSQQRLSLDLSSSDSSTSTNISPRSLGAEATIITDRKTIRVYPTSEEDTQISTIVKMTLPPSPMNNSTRCSNSTSNSQRMHILPSDSVDSLREISDASLQEASSRRGMERLEYGSTDI